MNTLCKRAIFLGDDEDIVGSVVNKVFSTQNARFSDFYEKFKRNREQGIFPDDVFLKGGERVVLLADTAGHRNFSEDVLTGRLKVDIVILLLLDDSDSSITDQYYKWIFYALLIKVPNVLVIGNLSELNIFEEFNKLLKDADFCPQLDKFEVNLSDLDLESADGLKNCIISCACSLSTCHSLSKQPMLMSVQEMFHLSGNRGVLAGRVIRGTLKEEMTVHISPGILSATNIIFETRRHCMREALPGDYMGFSISDKLHNKVKVGYMITEAPQDMQLTKLFTASICLNKSVEPLRCQDRIIVRSAFCEFEAELGEIQYKAHKRRLCHVNNVYRPSIIRGEELAVISLKPLNPLVLLSYLQSENMGKVEYLKEEEVIGRGLIMSID